VQASGASQGGTPTHPGGAPGVPPGASAGAAAEPLVTSAEPPLTSPLVPEVLGPWRPCQLAWGGGHASLTWQALAVTWKQLNPSWF